MMKILAAASLGAALVLAPLAAFAQTDAAPAATDSTDAAPAKAMEKAPMKHKTKKHMAKKDHKKMMKKEEAPAATDGGAAPMDAPKQ